MYVYVLLTSLANIMTLCVVGTHSLDEMEVMLHAYEYAFIHTYNIYIYNYI